MCNKYVETHCLIIDSGIMLCPTCCENNYAA